MNREKVWAGGYDASSTVRLTRTLQLYTRRTDDESRILHALTDEPGEGGQF